MSASAAIPTEQRPIAVLRALDKVTARVEELKIPVEQPLKFGTHVITVHDCRVTQPEETPEAATFLDVSEIKAGVAESPVFRGWMFASSPALSAMEHPVYDLWVTGCAALEPTPKTATPLPTAAPAAPQPPPTNAGKPRG